MKVLVTGNIESAFSVAEYARALELLHNYHVLITLFLTDGDHWQDPESAPSAMAWLTQIAGMHEIVQAFLTKPFTQNQPKPETTS